MISISSYTTCQRSSVVMFKKAVSDVLSFVIWHVMDVTEREASVIMKMLEVEAATVTYSEQLTVGLDT